jgi:flagellar assembly protein FliH
MSLFIRQRVVKGHAVEMTVPIVFSSESGNFERLYNRLPVFSLLPQKLDCKEIVLEDGSAEIACTLTEEIADIEDIEAIQEALKFEAEQILQDAESKARSILEKAKEEAEEIMSMAQQNVAKWKEEVIEIVRGEIIPIANLEADRIIDEAKSVLLLTQKVLASEMSRVDEELLHLIILLAERVIRTTLSVKPEYLLEIIKSLAEFPSEKEDMCLHISFADADRILQLTNESIFPCCWVKDDALRQGDIYLEHRNGVFDARIETQLDKMEHILREELMHGKVEQVK